LRNAFVVVFGLAAGSLLASQICLMMMREKPWRSAQESARNEREKLSRDDEVLSAEI
jgi:hypothetical protein